jgi:hypothetical protein
MNRKAAARLSADLDLAPGNGAIAQNADAMIVQRIPFPPRIVALEDGQFFFGQERLGHEWPD